MVLAICDSSFLSLPEVNDVLLMTFSISHPEGMLKYAVLTTLGSVAGCALLYAVGRKGGEAFLRRRFKDERLAKIHNWYDRQLIPLYHPSPQVLITSRNEQQQLRDYRVVAREIHRLRLDAGLVPRVWRTSPPSKRIY